MLAVLLLRFIFTLLVEETLLLALDESLKVAPVPVEPLTVQVNDVGGDSIEEVAIMGDDEDSGGPCLRATGEEGQSSNSALWGVWEVPLNLLQHLEELTCK